MQQLKLCKYIEKLFSKSNSNVGGYRFLETKRMGESQYELKWTLPREIIKSSGLSRVLINYMPQLNSYFWISIIIFLAFHEHYHNVNKSRVTNGVVTWFRVSKKCRKWNSKIEKMFFLRRSRSFTEIDLFSTERQCLWIYSALL